ncbi:MAG: NAD(P)H-hydrate dehydratase [Spirochaetia bacterium]|nr:NAD(P)H-hydrate dehydratase [Spirochaetia bacterium]
MYLVTSAEMKDIDKTTIERFGVTASILMENAGINVVEAMKNEYGRLFGRRVNVLCGGGNNGGDGFVVARHLKGEGAVVRIFFTGEYGSLSEESRLHYDAAFRYGIEIVPLKSIEQLRQAEVALTNCDVFVDALIGTGIKKDVDGFMAKLIVFINLLGRTVVAVDVPSGVDSDTGDIRGVAVYAALTVTFGLPKLGISVFPALEYTGKLLVADLNFPAQLLSIPRKHTLITAEIAASMMPYRHANANKGNFGPIFILGGSPGLTGAVVLSAKAALKSGAGIVTVGTAESLTGLVKSRSDEIITAGLKENNGFLSEAAFENAMELADKAKVVVIGPGIGRNRGTQSLVRKLVKDINKPIIIDADGINAFAEHKELLKITGKDVIITPHIGEMSRLTGIRIEDIIKDKFRVLRDFVDACGINVLLKDGRSIVIDRDKNIYVNSTGNSGLATPGSGDVLTGIIAALTAHSIQTVQAGIAANYVHGMAADMLLDTISEEGITAQDVVNTVPGAIKALKKTGGYR